MAVSIDQTTSLILSTASRIVQRAATTSIGTTGTTTATASASNSSSSSDNRPPQDKIIGISLAIASGLFIGSSFVLKKKGLLGANEKYHEEAGEGYGYLKNAFWWGGMTLMILGEGCNFVAYAFADAIIVTPMGALSVVICAILSAIFLKERLSFVGKMACFLCILGSITIPLNAPEHAAVKDIQEMQHYVISPGFLSYAGVILVGSLVTALWAGPRYGKKTMFVYISICSWIGGLSVVATQGLGSAIVAQGRGEQQFNQWFLYVLFVFVIGTLLTEIIYLNKALNIFNAAMVTPTYYVYFTSTTIITSAVLFQGFGGTPIQIVTIVLGFLTICSGVILLQISSSAKDVPDTAVFSGDLDQMRIIAEQEQPESEPKADTFRGTAGLLRTISKSRRKMEQDEAKRIREDKRLDQLQPIGEGESVEWDGIRRRKTVLAPGQPSIRRQRTQHPPLGMSHFPESEDEGARPASGAAGGAFGFGFRRKSRQTSSYQHGPVEEIGFTGVDHSSEQAGGDQNDAMKMDHIYGLPPGIKNMDQHDGSDDLPRRPMPWATGSRGSEEYTPADGELHPPSSPTMGKRTFSFQNVFHRTKENNQEQISTSRHSTRSFSNPLVKDATEEERLGLVKDNSHLHMPEHEDLSDDSESERYARDSHYDTIPVSARGDDRDLTRTLNFESSGSQSNPPRSGHPGSRPLPSTPKIDENDEEYL